jgi:hypothetical protein
MPIPIRNPPLRRYGYRKKGRIDHHQTEGSPNHSAPTEKTGTGRTAGKTEKEHVGKIQRGQKTEKGGNPTGTTDGYHGRWSGNRSRKNSMRKYSTG